MQRSGLTRISFRLLRMTVLSIVGFILFLVVFLYFFQHEMIYIPRRYDPALLRAAGALVEPISYETSSGRQVAYYVAPRGESGDGPADNPPGRLPDRLWMMFHGNAARGLDWLDFLEKVPDGRAGYLLFDYPGYGECEGKAWEPTVLESSRKALATLAERLGVERKELEGRLHMFGFSLGGAAALRLASEVEVRGLVVLAPFTSIRDMAKRTVGWPLCNLARDRYDNRAALAELSRREPRPRVTIIHGTSDTIVPIKLGRDLAAAHPGWVELIEARGADHNWLLELAEPAILSAMAVEGSD